MTIVAQLPFHYISLSLSLLCPISPTMAQQFSCDIDGICLACQTHLGEEEKLQCVKCVTLWHLSCLSMDMPTTLDDTMNMICSDCLNMERLFLPVTHQVHNNVNVDPMDAILVSEKRNNTNIADTNMSLSNTLIRDLQCFRCFGLYEWSVTVSSSTLYLKNMSFFFQSIYFSPSVIHL